MSGPDPSTRLARRLGLGDAVLVGLGSMIGAGVFAAIGPAARVAGSGLLVGLVLAALVAYCNATSSAQLAAVHPASGGTYVYGRRRLGPVSGFLAGWGFVVGKTASCAAMALTVGAYATPRWSRATAVLAVVALTAVNLGGIQKTARLTRIVVALVLLALVLVVVGAVAGGGAATSRFDDPLGHGVLGILQSAGLLFFAFAGYARIATLGEEVVEPAHTIPKAIPVALGITFLVYALVATAVLAAVGPSSLARSSSPLATAVGAGDLEALVPVVRIGGAIAGLGVLLSLLVGVSRTTFAMASDRELPGWFDAVHPTRRVPHRAELAVGLVVVLIVAVADLRQAIGFSSFCVLGYYAVTNAAALRLGDDERRWPRAWAAAGLLGCVGLAFTLPSRSVLTGAAVLLVGLLLRAARRS